jgi:hypothetical protein
VLAASVQCHLPSDRERLEHWAEIRQNGATKKENEAVWSYSTNNLTERTKERRKRTKERGGWYIPFSPRSRTDTGDWANEKRKEKIIQRKKPTDFWSALGVSHEHWDWELDWQSRNRQEKKSQSFS